MRERRRYGSYRLDHRRWLALGVLLLLVPTLSVAADRNQRLVGENQHRTEDAPTSWACTGNPPVQEGDLPPLSTLGSDPSLGAHSYHVGNNLNVAKARCYYNAYNRPKILSSDIEGVLPITAKNWWQNIESNHTLGQIHFEHFDPCLSNWATKGNAISDDASFPGLDWCRARDGGNLGQSYDTAPVGVLNWFKSQLHASAQDTVLRQNGLLYRRYGGTGGEKRTLRWVANLGGTSSFEDAPKRLQGYGFMGALAAGDLRLDSTAYLRTLRSFNVNFTRVWAVEQWTGLAVLTTQGVAPFAGAPYQEDHHSYSLAMDSEPFFKRLRQFVQNAADRGIVVQLSLFDKHGLVCDDTKGRYRDSPYRALNNSDGYMPQNGCACGSGEGILDDPDVPLVNCRPLADFINENASIDSVHRRFLSRVGQEVGGIGNALFEIINEAMAPFADDHGSHDGDWAPFNSSHPYPNEDFQQRMLQYMRLSLPLESTATANYVVRDAFNDDADGTQLGGKQSDIQGADWLPSWSSGAAVYVSDTEGQGDGSLGPPRKLGYVSSQATGSGMVGSVLIGSGDLWNKLEERADITCSSGRLQLGLNHTLGGNNVFAMVDCGHVFGGELTTPKIYLYEKVNGQAIVLGSTIFPAPYVQHNLRLELFLGSTGAIKAVVHLDGVNEIEGTLSDSSDFTSAFFWGSNCFGPPNCIYPKGAAILDNFEVARFCDDETRGCQP